MQTSDRLVLVKASYFHAGEKNTCQALARREDKLGMSEANIVEVSPPY